MDDTELYTTLLGIRPPWRVTRVQVNMAAERVDVWVEEAPGTKFPCASCRAPAAVYDHTPEQVWRHLDTCQCATYVHARLPRTACPVDGVRQVPAPWAEGRTEATRLFEARILDTCKECDVTGVRRLLRTTWDATWGVLERAVARGLRRKPRRVPARLGIDEKAVRKGHHYETLVVDLDTGTVEAVLDDRTQASLEAYYRQFTPAELASITAIAMDMWEPYIQATHAWVPDAAQKIVFDKYHATRYVTEAVDQVRRAESSRLRAAGKASAQQLKHMRWPLLRRGSRVRGRARQKLNALLASKLATARAWDLKETFSHFWGYKSVTWAGAFLDYWCYRALRSRLEPMKKVARMLRAHEELLLNWFRAQGEISNGAVEGLNNKLRVVTRRSYGFRTYDAMEIALYHTLGRLPEPESTHSFC